MSRVPDSSDRPDRGAENTTQEGSPDPLAGRNLDFSVVGAMVDARPDDPASMVVAQAVVAAELFGLEESGGLGRFQRFSRLAAGGMGVVYTAYDPDLQRMVAVKTVRVPGGDRSRALTEGRALARLSHVNVVPIYEVGFVGDQYLYFVMELVIGPTLRAWVKGRTQREIVAAYTQAGHALAAAHAIGLVHRDFKPDNAIMGSDGRVRVIDFGLACEETDPTRPHTLQKGRAGTPKYMPPEQMVGGEITAAADQYAFCTALSDALKDARGAIGAPLPRWLKAVVDRGCAPLPTDRFPSMAELLKALARDPALLRRKWRVWGSVVTAALAAFVARGLTLNARTAACNDGAARIAAVWGGDGRQAALARLATLGEYGRSVQPRLEAELGDHQSRWAAGYQSACVEHSQKTQSDAMFDRRMACLDRGRAALTSMAEIVQTADAKALPDLVLASRSLPDPDACGDLDALMTNVEPPATAISARVGALRAQLAGARVQLAAGRYQHARDVAQQAAAEARGLAYPPLIAEALLVAGHAAMSLGDRLAAIPPLTEAYTLAFQAGDQSLAVEAWARRAWTEGTSSGGAASLSGVDIVEAMAGHRSVSRFARALLYNNVGTVEGALARPERAHASFERALREAEGLTGAGAAELLGIRLNLAASSEDPDRRDVLFAEAVAEKAKALGDDHPGTLVARWQRGAYSVRFARTIEFLTATCASLEKHNDALAKGCWSEVGYVRGELADGPGAAEAMRRAAAIQVKREVGLTAVLPYLHFWQEEAMAAAGEFAAALEALPSRDDEPWWDRLERADLELGRARAERTAGNLRAARRSLDLATRLLTDIDGKDPYPGIDRRLGRARAELAKVLAATHAPPREIAAVAAPAAAWLRQAGGVESEIAELERLAER